MASREDILSSDLFAALRAFESGRPEGDYRQVSDKGRVLGAYQMRTPALRQIGALIPDGDVDNPSDWTGEFGADKDDFLANPDFQDDAAIQYMDWIANKSAVHGILQELDERPETAHCGVRITETGVLLAAWMRQDEAIAHARGRAVDKDILDRFAIGAIAEGQGDCVEGQLSEKVRRIYSLLDEYACETDGEREEKRDPEWAEWDKAASRWYDDVPEASSDCEEWGRFFERDDDNDDNRVDDERAADYPTTSERDDDN